MQSPRCFVTRDELIFNHGKSAKLHLRSGVATRELTVKVETRLNPESW